MPRRPPCGANGASGAESARRIVVVVQFSDAAGGVTRATGWPRGPLYTLSTTARQGIRRHAPCIWNGVPLTPVPWKKRCSTARTPA